jgi:hypothetical protein
MATALVRLIEGKNIVGMFVYRDPEDLFWLVDQATNPYECEFINIKYGGLIWKNESAPLFSDAFFNAWNADDDGELLNEVGSDETYDGAQLDEYAFEQAIDSDWTKITKKFKDE